MSGPVEPEAEDRRWSPVQKRGNHGGDLGDLLSRGFEPVNAGDWLMVGLAVLDILLLVARDVYADFLPGYAETTIVAIDLVILGIFALEFLGEVRQATSKLAYTRNHWYELVGMVPIAHWGFRAVRLVRLLRIYVVETYPMENVPERDWSYALVRGLINHYKGVLLEEITDPIVLTSISTLRDPMVRARWTETVGNSMEDHRENIHLSVRNALEDNPRVGVLVRTRPGKRLVREVTDATLDSVIHTLQSEELNEVVSESIDEVLDELSDRVREKEYRQRGGSVFRPAYDYEG
jgi:ribosome-associated translation inhibitor RaiA